MAEVRLNYWESPENVWREGLASDEQRNKLLGGFIEMVRQYEGPARHKDEASFAPENHYFEWISLVLSQLIAQNPKVRIGSKRPSVQNWDALALEMAVNRWCRDTHFDRYLERTGVYWSFFCGVGLTTVEKYGEFEDPRYRPRAIVLDPLQFGMDPLARFPEEARFMFHECAEDKDSLIARAKKEEGWNLEAVKMLQSEDDLGMGRPVADVKRGEVKYREFWVPELNENDDEEYHGKILTIGMSMLGGDRKAKFLREPRDYYGPQWGPYTLYGGYTVPRSAWPMAPLQAHEGAAAELNNAAKTNSISQSRRKTVAVYDEADKTTAEQLFKTEDGKGVGIPGFEKNKIEFWTHPGVTEDALIYEQYLRQRLVRISGLSDAVLSQSSTGSTATADAIASRALDARMASLEDKMYDGAERQLMTVAWYYWHDDRIVEPLGVEAIEQAQRAGMPLPPGAGLEYVGGDNQGKFADLELEIEAYSMQRRDEGRMQAITLQAFQAMTGAALVIPQTPWMPWEDMFRQLAETFNWPNMGKIDIPMAQQIGAMQMMAEMQSAQPTGGGGGKPRMAGDVGAAPRATKPSEYGKQPGLPGNQTGAQAGHAAKRETAA